MSRFSGDPAYQAFRILQLAFVVAPLIAGFDKFFYYIANWSQYICPLAMKFIGGQDRLFMMGVGIVEIVAGIGVLLKPRLFAYIVALWILCITVNLVLTGQYFDVALRDVGLFLAALALGRLSQKYA